MRNLSIDIESFHRSTFPNQVVTDMWSLLISRFCFSGYSLDGGAAQVVDLACGEKIPADVIAALTDEAVTKWRSTPASRGSASRFIGLPTGEYIDPASWHCSMVWAATMGLPLSLEA